MTRSVAELPKGARITDFISLGVISKTFPLTTIKEVLSRTGKSSQRQRELPAHELAALYHERWEIETALDELKTHLRGARIVLRSKTPTLVKQEFYGFMLAHYAIRGLMHEAALKENTDTDTLSFLHTVRVIRRKLPRFVSLPPSEKRGVS